MNRYVVFAGSDCYPQGGFDDFVTDFRNLSCAFKFVETIHEAGPYKEPAEWCHIVDMDRKEKIAGFIRKNKRDANGVSLLGEWDKWEEVSED